MKPIVMYAAAHSTVEAGSSALISGVSGHPRLRYDPDRLVITSVVTYVGKDGHFETLNTIYRRTDA